MGNGVDFRTGESFAVTMKSLLIFESFTVIIGKFLVF